MSDDTLTPVHGAKFASLVLAHVEREYPNKLDHLMFGDGDVQGPRALHPVFFGSFDWHSCVHGYWTLARLLRRFPSLDAADSIVALFERRFTDAAMGVEVAYAAGPSRATFERPYGWAWLLMLSAELAQHETTAGRRWHACLAPLAHVFEERYLAFLPRATYPIRTGTHFNTAFALALAAEYATVEERPALESLLRETALRWYGADRGCQGWEPGGDDFLSPALIEAECMRRLMPAADFPAWLDAFLPAIATGDPPSLFEPAHVSDRSDGKIAHLDGLNLSRAWCWRSIARVWPVGDPRRAGARRAVARHLDASLPHVAGDYMGEHWLATFALLALDQPTSA